MKTKNEFAGLGAKELQAMIAEERAKLRDMTLKISLGQFRAVRTVRKTKKTIARLETQVSVLSNAS